MTLRDMVDSRLVALDIEAADKAAVIDLAAEMLRDAGKITDTQSFIRAVFQREGEFSTGMGMGFAIPHCRSGVVKETCFAILRLREGIDWNAMDGAPVRYVILLAVPVEASAEFLKVLSTFSYNLMDDAFRDSLAKAASVEDIRQILSEKEE